jgi:hypothetical protein
MELLYAMLEHPSASSLGSSSLRERRSGHKGKMQGLLKALHKVVHASSRFD